MQFLYDVHFVVFNNLDNYIGIGIHFVYYKHMNNNKQNDSKFDCI